MLVARITDVSSGIRRETDKLAVYEERGMKVPLSH